MVYTKSEKDKFLPVASSPGMTAQIQQAQIDISTLQNELISRFSERNDRGVIVNFFKRRGMESQQKRIDALNSLVNSIRQTTSTMQQYQIEILNYSGAIQFIVNAKMELLREQFVTEIIRERAERERIKHDLETMRIRNESLAIQNEFERRRVQIIDKILEDMDFRNLRLQDAVVLIKILNKADTEADLMTFDAMRKKMEAEADRARAGADFAGHEAEMKKYKTRKMKKDLGSLGYELDDDD